LTVLAEGVFSLDLITPAQTWGAVPDAAEPDASYRDTAETAHEPRRMPWPQQVVMFCSVVGPIAGLVAAVVLLWHRERSSFGIGWPEILLMLGMYATTAFGVTLGYHRLLTHKAYETHRPIRLLLAILGSAAGQGMCIKWCATHRRHHQHADREGDPHSPHLHGDGPIGFIKGMWHAHFAWVFDADAPDLARSIPDLLADRALLLIDKLYFVWVFLGILIPGVILGLYYGTWMGFVSGALWGGLIRICTLQHVTWSINSVCHVWGTRPYNSSDDSKNNYPIAILSLGEGWHNNHHAFPTSARPGLHWWQLDASWPLQLAMKKLGLVWNLRLPSEAALAAKRRP
jgi:stearoyl-CoA desaturase (delta-9 desaturase)